ncbi:MAG: hypothetical protein NVSMB48_00350 [Marmoricola sp.]
MGRTHTTSAPAPWSRQRLLAALAALTATLAVALGVAGYYSLRVIVAGGRAATVSTTDHGVARRDAIAADPMLSVDPDAMYPATPAAQVAPRFPIPASHGVGPDSVPTGFPDTPAGAVAQLGAIGTAVFATMSMQVVTAIYRDWAIPGGFGASRWPLTDDVQQFLSGAQATTSMPPGVTIAAVPSGAIVKGTDGPHWVLACVLWQISETGGQPVELGYGYCERMQWIPLPTTVGGGRWEIAPGTPAAPAPNTWPGTVIAAQAGWKMWVAPVGAAGGSR